MSTDRIIELKTHVSSEVIIIFFLKIRKLSILSFFKKEVLWKELIGKLEPGFYDPKGDFCFEIFFLFY